MILDNLALATRLRRRRIRELLNALNEEEEPDFHGGSLFPRILTMLSQSRIRKGFEC